MCAVANEITPVSPFVVSATDETFPLSAAAKQASIPRGGLIIVIANDRCVLVVLKQVIVDSRPLRADG
jgi:hypothetical protein